MIALDLHGMWLFTNSTFTRSHLESAVSRDIRRVSHLTALRFEADFDAVILRETTSVVVKYIGHLLSLCSIMYQCYFPFRRVEWTFQALFLRLI